ncbi:hypothetical protein ACIGHF_11205 [Stenotrophomonas sp. NPDC077464]|uniref:hypothetical protein n=1 Tax=unclassified Stenotrophomonas TaxID=196198 RepID=UPI0037D353FE
MKILHALVMLGLSLTAGVASAQSAARCPALPAASGLQWQETTQSTYVLCKAVDTGGREVMTLMLTGRDPEIPLSRSLRQEKGGFAGESLYWYQPDLGGQEPPGYATRRMTVVKFDKNQYAQISLYPSDASELRSLQSMSQGLSLNPTAVAAER